MRFSPPWLEEGLAEYYSTLKIEGREAVVGTLPNQKILRVDIHIISSLIQGLAEERVDFSQLPTVKELLTADYATFHDPARELPFYAGSWVFVHMLINGPYGYSQRFGRFVEQLSTGVHPADAWRDCFYGVPVWRLEREFRRYITKPEMDARTLTLTLPKATRPDGERAMRGDEVHLTMARIRPWDTSENILAAGSELAAARQLAGAAPSAELRYWSGPLAPLPRGRSRPARGPGAGAGAGARLAGAVRAVVPARP